MSFPNSDFCEYIVRSLPRRRPRANLQANSADGTTIDPSFGNLFTNEVLPHNGTVNLTDEPGFGLTLNQDADLVPYSSFFTPGKGLGSDDSAVKDKTAKVNG